MTKFVWENRDEQNDSAWLHTETILSQTWLSSSHLREEQRVQLGAKLLLALVQIHGVQKVSIERYKVRIERTKVVSWDTICPAVEQMVTEFCQMQEVVPPQQEGASQQ